MKKAIPKLFVCVMPTGISYSDKSREVNGDYKKIAHLFFSDLRLDILAPRSPLVKEVMEDASKIQDRRGEQYQVSFAGQTVTLGGGF